MPMQRKRLPLWLAQVMKFMTGGAAFFFIGYALFSLLYGVFSWRWWVAKAVADLVGWAVNYLIQRYWAFVHPDLKGKNRRVFGKFTFISVVNLGIDYAIVGGLKLLGVSPFLGLFISSWFFTVWKFLWYKHWVFRH